MNSMSVQPHIASFSTAGNKNMVDTVKCVRLTLMLFDTGSRKNIKL
jgi:hypothetical protein